VTSGGLPEDHPALSFLDTGTFQFLALPKETFRTIPAYDRKASPGNGVTVGFGRADNRPVAVFVQDPAVSGGSLGLGEAEKICALMDAAVERGCPIVGFLHSGGARIQEGVDSLAGYGEIFQRNVRYSGEVPQVSVVLGPCAGGAVYSPALTDFVVLVRDRAQMFITGPDVIRQSTGEQTDRESLGGAAVHLTRSGVAISAPRRERRPVGWRVGFCRICHRAGARRRPEPNAPTKRVPSRRRPNGRAGTGAARSRYAPSSNPRRTPVRFWRCRRTTRGTS
jgi:acetyl-CoA carboxylase carboxyltransferase component